MQLDDGIQFSNPQERRRGSKWPFVLREAFLFSTRAQRLSFRRGGGGGRVGGEIRNEKIVIPPRRLFPFRAPKRPNRFPSLGLGSSQEDRCSSLLSRYICVYTSMLDKTRAIASSRVTDDGWFRKKRGLIVPGIVCRYRMLASF